MLHDIALSLARSRPYRALRERQPSLPGGPDRTTVERIARRGLHGAVLAVYWLESNEMVCRRHAIDRRLLTARLRPASSEALYVFAGDWRLLSQECVHCEWESEPNGIVEDCESP